MMVQDPVAKFIKQNVTSLVGIDFGKNLLCIGNCYAMRLQQWYRLLELFEGNPAIFTRVDVVEDAPVTVIVSQVLQQEPELCLRDVVVSVLICGLEFCLSHVESSDDDWFKLEQFWKSNDVPDAFVNFGQAQIAVPVDIEARPVVVGFFQVGRGVARRQFVVDDLDYFARFHFIS